MGKNRITAALLLFLCTNLPVISQVVINEYSCANRSDYADNYGEYEDWVELYNAGGAAVPLGNYFLSDELSQPLKWQLPAVSLNPGQRLMIFASDRNTSGGGYYHTSFKLTQTTNEVIVLSDINAVIIDSVTTRPTKVNHGRGRTTDGANTWSLFTNPTPNQPNAGAQTDYPAKPVFSQAAGFYGGPINVTITAGANTTIRYTTDGSEPTAVSAAYAGPVAINATTVLRARAFSTTPGVPTGFTETNTYFINVSHTLPVVSVADGNYNNLFNNGTPEIESHLEFFDASQAFQFESYGEVNPHGNDSWAFAQKGVDFVTRDEFGYDAEMNYPIFHTSSRPSYQRIMFKAGASDNYPFTWGNGGCHLRDAFIQSLAEKANLEVDYRRFESCILFINGQYWGVYEIREKVNDPDFTDYYYNQEKDDIDMLSYWGGLNIRYGSDTGWVNLYNFIMANSMATPANYAIVANTLNIQSVIDNYILNTYAVNSDWINWNTMWWRGRKNPIEKWKYALWDCDNIFNLGHNYSGWPTTDYTADPCDLDAQFQNAGPNMGHMDIFTRLMANNDFKSLFINRYAELTQTYLSCPYVLHHLDSIINILTPEMPGQIARWGGSMGDWQNNLQFIKTQINGRCQVIDQGVVDCYNVSGPYPLTVEVDPPLSGTVKVASISIPTYPWTQNFFGNVTLPIEATPSFGWNFCYWELNHHIINPDSSFAVASFLLTTSDTLIAHFCQDDSLNITYIVNPPGSGNIKVNGFTPSGYPWVKNYASNTPVNLQATPNAGYVFDTWSSNHNALSPSITNPQANFNVLYTDTIIAWFIVEPEEPEEPDTTEPPTMFIPNTFTPGSDGLNDLFIPHFNESVRGGKWQVFNRWGGLLFEGVIQQGWDGTHNGAPVPQGVYVYYIVYVDDITNEEKKIYGHITLIR